MTLRKTRETLELSPMDIKTKTGIPVTILLDLEEADPRVMAHEAYKSYREMLDQFYKDLNCGD